ncbi:MAG: acyl-CoA dehydrogenase family protein [Anaerolineae bacterium]|nr:acyl-CoA dehydrogenase family protein [Anaerolineae bacterium]
MERTIFEEEHKMFRSSFRKFAEQEVAPHHEKWEKEGIVPRELWEKAGQYGFLGMDVPEEYGGGGIKDFRYNAIVGEELIRVGASGVGFGLHSDIVIPYILAYGSDEQKQRWLPKMVSGEMITAIAMSEPSAGSDLQGIRTTAVKDSSNGHYTVHGSKTFITNGINSDFVLAVCKTDPEAGHKGISLIAIERGMEGFTRGRNLEKVGLKAQDTSELFFDNVKVPSENLLGDEGMGFYYLMMQLPQERLAIAVGAMAACQSMLEMTINYCQEREAFGRPIGKFQNSRFKLAEMKTEITIGQVFIDRCIMELNDNNLTAEEAAMAKWWTTDLQNRVADQCLQLHGGYGYMLEYPIAKAWMDSRVQSIYGGTNEIMKEIIGRAMGF